jgi:hypothetical protein
MKSENPLLKNYVNRTRVDDACKSSHRVLLGCLREEIQISLAVDKSA